MLNEQANMNKQVWPAQAGRATTASCTQPQPVWFEYSYGAACEVTIVGSFNQWDVPDTRMVRLAGGRWVRVLFLPPGRYEYLFVVDGRCMADPRATESEPNVFGSMNSVLTVPTRVPKNGYAKHMIGRRSVPSPRALVKSKIRFCREAIVSQHAHGSNNRKEVKIIF